MADKKTEAELEMEDDDGPEEDTRDIFDKALDYAPFIGTLIGGLAGARMGSKELKKISRRLKTVEKKWDELRSRNQIRGLTPKAGTEMYNLEKEMERLHRMGGTNIAGRMLIKMPVGAVIGNTAGHMSQDFAPTRQGKNEKRRK